MAVLAIVMAARSRSRSTVVAVGVLAMLLIPLILFGVLIHELEQDHS